MTKKIGRNVCEEVRGAVVRAVVREVGDAVGDDIGNQVGDAVGDEGWREIRNSLYNLTGEWV